MEKLSKLTEAEQRKLTFGCFLHLGVLLICLGLGYYLGFGLTLLAYGAWWIVWTGYKMITTKEIKSDDTPKP